MLGLGVMRLVDRDGGVNNLWSNCFLLDDGLNGLVDMVMDTFAFDGGCCGGGMLSTVRGRAVLELGRLSGELAAGRLLITVRE